MNIDELNTRIAKLNADIAFMDKAIKRQEAEQATCTSRRYLQIAERLSEDIDEWGRLVEERKALMVQLAKLQPAELVIA